MGETCVLVFDEIDTGISGQTAAIVGRKLKDLSMGHQVICVSHLAQVSAYAQRHFKVEKLSKKSRTTSTLRQLSEKEASEEVARLLSGTKITPSSLKNARSLIKTAQQEVF